MEKKSNISYKDTLNLPRTSFPMKAGLSQKEPQILKRWAESDIYGKVTRNREGSGKTFILHDGPPYANGHIHMGHLLNKILKDICVKFFTMRNYFSPYVPGWDCHGLPVEHQLFKELKKTKDDIGQVEFRKKAHNYAMKYVRIQAEEFKRLGIFGNWNDPYLTLSKDYESGILFALADLYEKGYIYKGLKPVNWCKACETALAEAEVEYEEKASPSIYVKFGSSVNISGKKTFFVIWTTTPWTLLANVAVALHPELLYSVVDVKDEVWIMASDLVPSVMKKIGLAEYAVIETTAGKDIVGTVKKARHPFIERDSVLVLADYVARDEGTGCVHTAPGHGMDDYLIGERHGLAVIMPVDGKGKFTGEAPGFSGLDVFEANEPIVDLLRKNGTLVSREDVTHSYPHCWRCKEPVIFRATKQWFMRIDHKGLRDEMMKAIREKVEWIPSAAVWRISSMIETRPDWCLSRQRYWGVPIPALRCKKCGESFMNADLIRNIASMAKTSGVDVWFEKGLGELIPREISCEKCGNTDLEKEEDILDVWFDSGVSHQAVLGTREELGFPADLYLEGSDQHRGWFQAALITSMAITGAPPYRKVLTHGFVVDGEGKKMSKSVGNVISPCDVMGTYGADILRLWVASSNYDNDIKLSPEILARLADGYRKIRNTFRYLLSNLYDFDMTRDAVAPEDLPEAERWMLSRLYGLIRSVTEHYEAWEFHRVYRSVYDFCVYEVSSFYLDIAKDILYILTPDSRERRAVQTVIFHIFSTLTHVMAPILPFTSEEAWEHLSLEGKSQSVHIDDWPDTDGGVHIWEARDLDVKWEKILTIRTAIMKALEIKRGNGLIASSLEAGISFYADDDGMRDFLSENVGIFPNLFRVSQVNIADTPGEDMEPVPGYPLRVLINKAPGEKCPRCWNFSDSIGNNTQYPDLCSRCCSVMQGKEI